MRRAFIWLFRLGGVVMIANGLWMEVGALNWFHTIPAGLSDTGHPNGHFIRDVGLAYLIFGATLSWSSYNFAQRRAAYLGVAAFMIGHAIGHVGEITLQMLPPAHWLLDLPSVLAPGVIFAVFVHPKAWRWLTRARKA